MLGNHLCSPTRVITDKLSRFREEKKTFTDFQSCYIVITFYFKDILWSEDYNIFLSNVMKLKSQVSRKNNTQVKYRYSKSVLKYNTQVNILSYGYTQIIQHLLCFIRRHTTVLCGFIGNILTYII